MHLKRACATIAVAIALIAIVHGQTASALPKAGDCHDGPRDRDDRRPLLGVLPTRVIDFAQASISTIF
jgi:hypothetical protein